MDRALELLGKVRAGTVAGKDLLPETRQQLVMLLTADGLSTYEIAQVLKVADRTIERDRRAIRDLHAVDKDPQLVRQIVGQLIGEAQLTCQRMRRVAREKDVAPAVKIDAEHRCFQVIDLLTERLQKLGYLPTAIQRVDANLTHQVSEIPTGEELHAELLRIRAIAGEEQSEGLADVEDVLARATAATRLRRARLTVGDSDIVAEFDPPATTKLLRARRNMQGPKPRSNHPGGTDR